VVNNASAISLTPTEYTDMKKYDLMSQINGRGTFLVSKLAIPILKKSKQAHILMLSPPMAMQPAWFAPNLAYTMAKFNMSMCVLGLAEELKQHVNIHLTGKFSVTKSLPLYIENWCECVMAKNHNSYRGTTGHHIW
jgi:NAD(P)-dependent dehydrogenase (short-subunit alcohol dehydrogenase family)